MSTKHFGIVFIYIGLVMLACGSLATESVADSRSNSAFGCYTLATSYCLDTGLVVLILGALMLFTGGRSQLRH